MNDKRKGDSATGADTRVAMVSWRDASASFQLDDHHLANIEEFEKDVSGFLDGHTHMAVSYVGLKSAKGLVLVLVSIQPVTTDVKLPPDVIEETSSLVAGFNLFPISDGAGHRYIADVLQRRGIDTPFGPLTMERKEGERFSVYYQSFAALFERTLGANAHSILDITGESFTTGVLQWLDSPEAALELRANPRPFHDVGDIFDVVHLLPARRERSNAGIRFIGGAPLVLMPGYTLSSGRVKGRVRLSSKVVPGDVRLNVRAVTLEKEITIERESWPLGDTTQDNAGGFVVAEVEQNLKPASFVNLYLTYRGRTVQQFFIADPKRSANPLSIAYKHGDPELVLLTKWLSGDGNNPGPNFERAVAVLAGLRGFSTMHLGSGDSVDVCATTPRGNMLLIECTTGRPNNNDRVGGLVLRHRQARIALDKSDLSWVRVLPVMATSLPRATIQEEIDEARSKRVVVLAREDLLAQLKLIDGVPDADSVFSDMESNLPDPLLARLGR